MFSWLKIELKLRLNFTNLSGLAIAILAAQRSDWETALIGAILILGRKALSLIKIYIDARYN